MFAEDDADGPVRRASSKALSASRLARRVCSVGLNTPCSKFAVRFSSSCLTTFRRVAVTFVTLIAALVDASDFPLELLYEELCMVFCQQVMLKEGERGGF